MKIKNHLWAYPKNKSVWVLFDLSNGDILCHRYLWWFDTYKTAMDHRRHQKKMKYGADLSMPVKMTLATDLEK